MPMHANRWGNTTSTWRSQGASDKARSLGASLPRLTTPRSISTTATAYQTTIRYDLRQSKHIFTKINISEPKPTDNIWIGTSHVFLPTFFAKNATSGQAIMISSMTNGFVGKTIKTHKWRKWMNNTNKQNRTTTDPHIIRLSIDTTITNVRIAIQIVIRTRTNDPEMIALDQTRVIAPTPNRAVRTAQVVITTETVHTYKMTKRSTKIYTMQYTQNHTRYHKKLTQKNATKLIHYPEKQKPRKSKR
jgi:hypothetical protein